MLYKDKAPTCASHCRVCNRNIKKGEERLAFSYKSGFYGIGIYFYHVKCVAKVLKKGVKSGILV